tara:strand:+ start:321 stop:1025 length:705 start_codon:yes stop_codon:yes gene_type:complete
MKYLVATSLLASFVAGTATADVLYYQGFEDESYVGGQYTDTGDAAVDHWLSNNEGEAAVNGDGFNAWYGSTGSNGLTDGDWVGVTSYAGTVGAWYEGSQGYQMSDTDGIMELHFDGYEGFADTVSVAIFVQSTGWEAADSISMHWGDADENGTGPLFSTIGQDIDDLEIEGEWMLMEFDVSDAGSGHFHIRFESNSSSESLFIDSVSIMGSAIPAPGALALLGVAGLATRRRRK